MNSLYDVVSGSVNKDASLAIIKYTSLLQVSENVPAMIAIIHYDVKGQRRTLKLHTVNLAADLPALWEFMYTFLRASANAPLFIDAYSIDALVQCLQGEDSSGYLAKLKYVYEANMQAAVNGAPNNARYEDVASIVAFARHETATSQTLTFNLK